MFESRKASTATFPPLLPGVLIASGLVFSPLVFSCASSVPGGVEEKVDARQTRRTPDARRTPRPDARRLPDARMAPDASTLGPVTITASCLFLRTGAGSSNPKVACTNTGAWCNSANDVCMPMGATATVTGAFKPSGDGCTAKWYPLDFNIYHGWACGSFLNFPASLRALLPADHVTLFPDVAAGPQG